MFLGQKYQRGTVLMDNHKHSSHETLNSGEPVIDHDSQRWDVELIVRPSPGFTRKVKAHRARELWSSFTIPCPQDDDTGPFDGYLHNYPDATRLNLTKKASKGSGTVEVRKGSLDLVTLRTGRYISFAGHTKIYMVDNESDIDFIDTTTAVNVNIYPNLIEDVVVSYIRLNPDITVKHAPNHDWAYTGHWLYQDTIYLHEVVAA